MTRPVPHTLLQPVRLSPPVTCSPLGWTLPPLQYVLSGKAPGCQGPLGVSLSSGRWMSGLSKKAASPSRKGEMG